MITSVENKKCPYCKKEIEVYVKEYGPHEDRPDPFMSSNVTLKKCRKKKGKFNLEYEATQEGTR